MRYKVLQSGKTLLTDLAVFANIKASVWSGVKKCKKGINCMQWGTGMQKIGVHLWWNSS